MGVNRQLHEIAEENVRLKNQNAATEIKLKHAHLKMKDEMNKRVEQEGVMHHYVSVVTHVRDLCHPLVNCQVLKTFVSLVLSSIL
jgi:hypothetical protein